MLNKCYFSSFFRASFSLEDNQYFQECQHLPAFPILTRFVSKRRTIWLPSYRGLAGYQALEDFLKDL